MDEDVEWPPPEARVQSALWRAEEHIERAEYAQAARALADVAGAASAGEHELVRGLIHLAAAGRKHQHGDRSRALRQLAHARRRLGRYLPEHREVDRAALLSLVERKVES